MFPTRSLMAFTALFAVWLTAARYPSPLLTSALFTAALGFLATATCRALAGRGDRAAFWKGAAVCGWCYFVFAFGPSFAAGTGPYFLPEILLNDLSLLMRSGGTYFVASLWQPPAFARREFVTCGHAFLCVAVAVGGGKLASRP